MRDQFVERQEGLQMSESSASDLLLDFDSPQVRELQLSLLGLHLFRLKQNFGHLR